jgi:hypothetical protein
VGIIVLRWTLFRWTERAKQGIEKRRGEEGCEVWIQEIGMAFTHCLSKSGSSAGLEKLFMKLSIPESKQYSTRRGRKEWRGEKDRQLDARSFCEEGLNKKMERGREILVSNQIDGRIASEPGHGDENGDCAR